MTLSSNSAKRHETKGFALITSLAAVCLAIMMLGAFFISHRSFISLSRESGDRKACRETVLALADYCRYRLEKEKGWSVVAPTVDPESIVVPSQPTQSILVLDWLTPDEVVAGVDLDDLQGLNHFVGNMPSNGVGFHLALSNNLAATTASSSDGVAPKTCRIRIEAKRGSATERVELILRKMAYFDSTVFASEYINIEATQATFNSNDAVRNQIRSLHSIQLPGSDQLKFREGQIDPPAIKGTVWAQDTDQVAGDARGSISVGGVTTNEALQAAALQTGAQFMPDDPGRYNPPRLNKDDLTSFEGTMPLEPATYFVSAAAVSYTKEGSGETKTAIVKTVQRYDPSDPPSIDVYPPPFQPPPTDFYFLESELPEDADLDLPVDMVLDPLVYGDAPPMPASHGQASDGFDLPSGLRASLRVPPPTAEGAVPVWEPLIVLPADQKLSVKDNTGTPGAPGLADFKILCTPQGIPEISFQNADESPGRGYIDADRDITLQGRITGSAQLLSGRDINLIPVDVQALADYESDVALFAKDNVTIEPLVTGNSATLDAGGFFTFRGLVYAGKNFEFRSSVGGFSYDRQLSIEGALVAREGFVSIQGNSKTTITYEPKFLDKFLERDAIEDNVQIEELSWRPL